MRTIHKHVDATGGKPRVLEVQHVPAENTTGGEDLLRVRIDAPGERAVSLVMTLPDWSTMQQAVEDALAAPPDAPPA